MAAPTKAEQQAYYDAIVYIWPEYKDNEKFSPDRVSRVMIDACDKMFDAVAECTKTVYPLTNAYAGIYNGIRPSGWFDILVAGGQMFYNWWHDTQNLNWFWKLKYGNCIGNAMSSYGTEVRMYIEGY